MDQSVCSPLPRYKCHKEVGAIKISEVVPNSLPPGGSLLHVEGGQFCPIPVTEEWHAKHKPEAGGYYVVYDDGYKSYSPAKAFEEGYTKI